MATWVGKMVKLAIIADDLTGAADAVLPFARAGWATSVTTNALEVGRLLAHDRVVGVDVGTREAAGPLAYLAVFGACQEALRVGAVPYKKVDSRLRGKPALEVGAALDAWPEAIAIVAPALPHMGRVVRDGRLQGPDLAPIEMAEVFSGPWRGGLARVSRRELAPGAVRDRLESLAPGSVVLADAENEDQLLALVSAAWGGDRAVLWVGAAGLSSALIAHLRSVASPASTMTARSDAASDAAAPRPTGATRPPGGRGILVLVATQERVGRLQLAALAHRTGAVVSELALEQAAVASWVASERSALSARLEAGEVVALCSAWPKPGAAERDDHAKLMAVGACALIASGVAVDLVATGGKMARCLLDAIGEQSCRILGEVGPGMPLLETERHGFGLVTKAGSFGTELSLVGAVAVLRSWRSRGGMGKASYVATSDRKGSRAVTEGFGEPRR